MPMANMEVETVTEEPAGIVNNDTVCVAGALHELMVCARCILRFIGERCPSSYDGSYESIVTSVSTKFGITFEENPMDDSSDSLKVESENDDRAVSSSGQAPCVACLGILQHECDSPIVKKIEDAVEVSGFDFDGFTFAVSLPLSVLVRQHSIFLFLKEKFSSYYSDVKSVGSLPSIKDVFKWVCGPALGSSMGVFFQHESPFKISITFNQSDGNKELEFLADVDPTRFKERKKKKRAPEIPMYSVSSISKALVALDTADQFRKYSYCPPRPPISRGRCVDVVCSHGAVLLAGRYNKYSRRLPQTPWVIDGKRHLESSVQEKICDIIMPKIKADDCRFSSGGREDVDVRMLGTGRPFVVEFVNPRKTMLSSTFLSDVQNEINSSTTDIAIRDLQVVTKEDYSTLKEAENKKTKTYSALVWTEKEITRGDLDKLAEIKDLTLAQKTPLRVLHRRPLAVREKMVHGMTTKWIDPHHFRLYLKTMAGTYVKEFVHGDFGRTKPNLGILLGMETDILELDVESVDVNWPPSHDNESTTTNTAVQHQAPN